MSEDAVKFGSTKVALAGLVVAGGVAIGVPALVLYLGAGLGAGIQTTLIILALVGGVLLGVVSAFFGIVIPSSVSGQHDRRPRGRVKITKENGRKVIEVDPAADAPETPAPADQTATERP